MSEDERDIAAGLFLQAKEGIRDLTVTGVQTCALPISLRRHRPRQSLPPAARGDLVGPALSRVPGRHPDRGASRAVPRLWREMESVARPPAVYSDRARPGVPLRGMSARAWG